MAFQKAVRTAKRAKIALSGPSGSGKTATALRLARGLVGPNGKVAVIDTERGSASLYAGRFGGEWDKDDELPDYSPKTLMDRLREAERLGYDAVVVDSLSHFWMGTGGELEMVDAAKKRSKSGDGFGAWKEVTPVHNELIQCILTARLHVVCTMRTKTEWVVEQNERGKNAPRKVGTAPVQRDGMEYEFDLAGDMDGATMVVSKTRLEPIPLGAVFKEPGEALGEQLAAWLAGAPAASEKTKQPAVNVYQTARDLLKVAPTPAKVNELMKRAKGKTTPEEAVLLEDAARERLDQLRARNPIAGDGPPPGVNPEDECPEPGGDG